MAAAMPAAESASNMGPLRQQFLLGMSYAACTVNVVTTDGVAGRHGITVSAMVSVSADTPRPTLLVCIHHLSPVADALLQNGVFCVNVLREDQAHISDAFAGRSLVESRQEQPAGDRNCGRTTPRPDGAGIHCALPRLLSMESSMHTRIRKFNTRDTYPEQKLDNDLCQTVVARGTTVFVRGQVGQDLDTAVNVGVGDAAAQADKAMANIEQLLSEAGARLEHICKVTIYLTDPRFREPVYRTIGRWLKGVYPVSTGIVVAGLARPEWLVEVDVIAVIPDAAANT